MPNERHEQLDAGTQTLVEDLHEKPESFDRNEIIRRALLGRYHDFKSSDPTPKVTLDRHLRSAGFSDLVTKCRNGDYDQGVEEANKWAESLEGQEAIRDLMKDEK